MAMHNNRISGTVSLKHKGTFIVSSRNGLSGGVLILSSHIKYLIVGFPEKVIYHYFCDA